MTVIEESAMELGQFYTYDKKRGFMVLDCLSGKPAWRSGVPYFIQHTAEYKRGIAVLHKMSNLTCNFWLAYHGSAEDLGPEGSFEKAVQHTDLFIPEATGYDSEGEGIYNRIANAAFPVDSKLIEAVIDPTLRPELLQLHKRLLSALYGTHALVKLADISKADMEKIPALANIYSTSRKYSYNSSLDPLQKLLWVGLVCYHREWLIAAKLGAALQSLPATLSDKPNLSVLFFLGAMHYGLVAKLEGLGVRCRILYHADESPLKSGVREMGKVFAQSTYTPEDGQKYAAYIEKLY